jgi:site-specific recombinase XerD
MRKFYEHVLGTSWEVEHLPRPRKERSLPSVLSKEEVSRLLNHGRTLKHQAFMALLYGTGLRLSEALNLHIVDIDATHHLESGTTLVYLKEQMGHKNLKTTARYIHLSQEYHNRICHPLAELELILKEQGQ